MWGSRHLAEAVPAIWPSRFRFWVRDPVAREISLPASSGRRDPVPKIETRTNGTPYPDDGIPFYLL